MDLARRGRRGETGTKVSMKGNTGQGVKEEGKREPDREYRRRDELLWTVKFGGVEQEYRDAKSLTGPKLQSTETEVMGGESYDGWAKRECQREGRDMRGGRGGARCRKLLKAIGTFGCGTSDNSGKSSGVEGMSVKGRDAITRNGRRGMSKKGEKGRGRSLAGDVHVEVVGQYWPKKDAAARRMLNVGNT
ncbi:hypothetical protein B0H10DRAFT_1940244 [Mycena sp. CBHHK59/15]|nr:hypothetical protein B0H10DRAFT_1940244 [Mycena sp. CBHHK59/15]